MDDVVSVSCMGLVTMAIQVDGSLWSWGIADFSPVHEIPFEGHHYPIRIMDDVAHVSVGGQHVMAIKADGSLWGWGWEDWIPGDGMPEGSYIPTHIMDDVVSVFAGVASTMAIKTDGSLWAWGHNWDGHLGDGTSTERLLYPTHIMDDIAAVALGSMTTLAVQSDGSLWGWGWFSNMYPLLRRDMPDDFCLDSIPLDVCIDDYTYVHGRVLTPTKVLDGVMLLIQSR